MALERERESMIISLQLIMIRELGPAMLRASQVTVIKQDDVKQLHCFESPLDYVTQNPSRTSVTWNVAGQNHHHELL